MKRLKIVLHCKWFYCGLLCLSLIFSLLEITKPLTSVYSEDDTIFIGTIVSVKKSSEIVSIKIKAEESLRGTYYLDNKESFSYNVGDVVKIIGTLEKGSHNTIPNLFDYADYLRSKGESWVLQIDYIEKIGESKNIINILKRSIINKIDTYKSKDYLKVFLIGDQSELDTEIVSSYRENGISHLFSISGMHLSFLSGILIFIMSKVRGISNVSYLITCVLLVFYMFLVGCSASVVRACIFFIFRYIYSLLRIKVPIQYIFLLMISIVLFIKPSFILDVGFQYSISISYFLLIKSSNGSKNYFLSMLEVSILSFFVSLPISLYYFYQVNFLGIIYNLIFVPSVSLIIFPLSFITFFFPFFDTIFYFLTNIMESLSIILAKISYGKVIFMKPMVWWIVLYYLFLILQCKKKYIRFFLIMLIILLYFYPKIVTFKEVMMIDVGQGDSILVESQGKSLLIDTGGKFYKYSNNSITATKLLPLFKSKGIRKLNYLVLTHGDFDHMGEAINLVENFKVEKVIFNCGGFNELEQELIKILVQKKIPYYSCIKELNIDDNKLYFLNNDDYVNENDNSSVIYTELNNHKFLFIGDAGVEVEEDLIKKYNLKNIDVLKVGHHGSRTSSSKYFIDEIKPKYSVISVGKNNRYGHPNKDVLDNLEDSKIYRTDQDGSIIFKINNNKLKIETCNS